MKKNKKERVKENMKRRLLSLLVITSMIATATFVGGCGEAATEEEEEDIVTVEVGHPSNGNISVTSEFMGVLEHSDETEVFAKMSGEITDTFFEVGDYVNEGDVLFTLDDEAAQLQVKSASATYQNAKAGTAQQLGALQMNHDNAVNSVESAKEGISQLQDTYNYYEKQWGDLEEKKSETYDDQDDLRDDRKDLKESKKEAKEGAEAAKNNYMAKVREYETLKQTALASPGTIEDWQIEDARIAMENAQSAYEGAAGAAASIDQAIDSIDNGIDGYDSAVDTIESNQDSIAFQKNNTVYSYKQAVRGAELAQENLDYIDNVTAPATIESADATLKSAQVAVDSAKMQLDYCKVTAPVSGRIEKKNVEKFGMVQAGAPAYIITNEDGIIANFKVTESVFNTLSLGQEIVVERNGKEYKGKISELPLTIDSVSGLFEIKATVSGASDELLSGTAVKITATTEHVENVMTIPVDCVYYDSEEAFVYTMVDGVVKKVYVEVGLFDDKNIDVLSGLKTEDTVITSWSSELRDGLKVTAKED